MNNLFDSYKNYAINTIWMNTSSGGKFHFGGFKNDNENVICYIPYGYVLIKKEQFYKNCIPYPRFLFEKIYGFLFNTPKIGTKWKYHNWTSPITRDPVTGDFDFGPDKFVEITDTFFDELEMTGYIYFKDLYEDKHEILNLFDFKNHYKSDDKSLFR